MYAWDKHGVVYRERVEDPWSRPPAVKLAGDYLELYLSDARGPGTAMPDTPIARMCWHMTADLENHDFDEDEFNQHVDALIAEARADVYEYIETP